MINEGRVRGLDLGTSRIVLAEAQGDFNYVYKSQLNAFVSLPRSNLTAKILEREGILNRVGEEEIIAYGDRVEEFANLLNGDVRRPMQTGLLNPDEPKSLEMIELALRRMCGPANGTEDRICFSTPSAPPTNEQDLVYHERTVTQILEGLGYKVRSLNEGLAVVYSELEDDNFTGIGLSFGGGMCNVCVAYLGLPAVSFSTTRGGDYIDRSAASVSGETVTTVRLHKEAGFHLNGLSRNSVDQALSVYYGDVIQTVAEGLEQALGETKRLPKLERPLPMVLSGGTSLVGSFQPELEKAIRARKLPLAISDIRTARDPLHTTARGALIAAMLEM